ncbi:MAG: hypothetical protein L3K15_03675 [Thermoplasmata archaeon]|nr:hypothetical protein [Thermoplasmata archaeon]
MPDLTSTDLTALQTLVDVKDISAIIATVSSSISSGSDLTPDDVRSLLQEIVQIVSSISTLSGDPSLSTVPPFNDPNFDWGKFAENLLGNLVDDRLRSDLPWLHAVLHAVGIIQSRSVDVAGAAGRVNYVETKIHLERVALVVNPRKLLSDVYAWGGSSFDPGAFLQILSDLLAVFGVASTIGTPDPTLLQKYYAPANANTSLVKQLSLPVLVSDTISATTDVLSLSALPIPVGDGTGAPVGVALLAIANGVPTGATFGEWSVTLIGLPTAAWFGGLEFRPGGAIKVATDFVLDGSKPLGLVAAYTPSDVSRSIYLFGGDQSNALRISDLTCSIQVVDPGGNPEVVLSLGTKNAQININFGDPDSDSFISSVLGTLNQTVKFANLGVIWSSKSGLHFSGSGSIEINIAIHQTLGPVSLDSITIGLGADGTGLTLSLAVSGGFVLGPISATIDKVGLSVVLRSQLASGGSSKPANALPIGLAFRPPDGLGFAVDAVAVSGGGYVGYDATSGEYSGILELGIDVPVLTVQVTVIGILDTRLPNGQQGYSLLLIVTAQFPPIQLGFGFTLTGLGGLMGINRTMALDALQAAVKSHSLDDILFPEDPIAHAPQIVSEVGTIFPVALGRFVFGPIVEIGWGTPQIVQAEIGLILEVPEPIRLALIGQLRVGFPTLDGSKPDIVLIQLEIVGTVDFGKKILSIYAEIYDSQIAGFALAGQFALVLTWGTDSSFAASAGGFYPGFQAPPNFPALQRVSIGLAQSSCSLSLQSYIASASNSVQAGAEFLLDVSADGFTIKGNLGFDALVTTKPSIHFIVEIYGSLEVLQGNTTLFSVSVHVSLEGPGPFHAHADATFDILGVPVHFQKDATFGDPASVVTIPAVILLDILNGAVQDSRNWAAVLPTGVETGFTFANSAAPALGQPTSGSTPLLVHPTGSLVFRQKHAPLDTLLDTVEGAPLGDVSQATITAVKVGTSTVPNTVVQQDSFARGQFQNLSDADKVSKPPFEPMNSGIAFGSDGFSVGSYQPATLTYDPYYVGDPLFPSVLVAIEPAMMPLMALSAQQVVQFARLGGAATAPGQRSGTLQFGQSTSGASFLPTPPGFLVTDTATATRRSDITRVATTRVGAEAQLGAYLAVHPQESGTLQVSASYAAGRT